MIVPYTESYRDLLQFSVTESLQFLRPVTESLQFLRPNAIKKTFKYTYYDEKALVDFYKLTDGEAESVAVRLLSQTTGKPQFLLEACKYCNTKEKLMGYVVPSVIENYKEFSSHILNFKKEILKLMRVAEAGTAVDLTEQIFSQGQKSTNEIIANHAFIAWEGELNAAKLTVSEPTKQYLARNFEPLSEFCGRLEEICWFRWIFLISLKS